MSQFSMSISDEAGAAFLGHVNEGLQALVSHNSGLTAPSTMYAYMFWADTTTGIMKQRNAANAAWLELWPLTGVHSSFTPTVTLVGGAGNTVPVYTTNTGRVIKIGNRAFCDVYLTGDGGAEGAGTGVVTLALPYTIGASVPAGYVVLGRVSNTSDRVLIGTFAAGAAVLSLGMFTSATAVDSLKGDDQNNAGRGIRASFNYETA